MTQQLRSVGLGICLTVLSLILSATPLQTYHDEPGSFREYELRQERVDIEINITELLYQLTYVPVSVRPRVYDEIEQLQQRWNAVVLELIEIDRVEHPQPPVK
jgi:hypothetical protein